MKQTVCLESQNVWAWVFWSGFHFLGGGFKKNYFHPYLGKIPILTNIFQMGGSTTKQFCDHMSSEASQS